MVEAQAQQAGEMAWYVVDTCAGFENKAEDHHALSEDLSFRRVLGLSRNVLGIAL